LIALGSGGVLASAQVARQAGVVELPLPGKPNNHYVGNRAPLLPSALNKLPIGSIRPEGWIRGQLRLMADGFTGHLPEISQWCKFEGSAWANPKGEGRFGWEELPYWLKGFTDLGYVLGDERIIGQARKWIEAILATQREDGYFGTAENLKTPDLWPNMVALYALRSHHEATGDPRIVPFMTRYFRWLTTVPRDRFLPESWQKVRGGDNLDSIYWVYNRTGEDRLLELAKLNHERTADWTHGIPTWHGVNLAQGFREPAQYYQQSFDLTDLEATLRNYQMIYSKYGQVPGGMYGADENAREGYVGPRQGTETCAMVEMMWSCEMLLGITGNSQWGDRCEDVAFNSFPASMTPDLKGLHYLTCPNQIQLDRTNKAPMIQNEGDMFSYNPHDYRCCQHNVAFGWPYFAEHLWMATPDNGLAAALYGPCRVTAKVGQDSEVSITETTDYPFDERISFVVYVSKTTRFPLFLRLPAWCRNPQVVVNGEQFKIAPDIKGWIHLDRTWKEGDRVDLILPMRVSVRVWAKNKNALSVDRGPLTYSLKIGEDWRRSGGTDTWPAFEVFPTTPWNWGLIVNLQEPATSFTIEKRDGKLAAQPFTQQDAPITLKAKARIIREWKQENNGLIAEVQQSPVASPELTETVTLIPMGCARLRISAFPRIGEGKDARPWR
jgi:DUF1680 family protein